ncbi:MAG: hypothetical protein AMXMBFR84_08020 [Candidatus Hydrogenedentota bacterium]
MYGNVLVIGGGIAGIRAALDLAESGVGVVLVETEPVIGGTMAARLSEAGETFHVGPGNQVPHPLPVSQHPNIELLTLSDLVSLEGTPGRFVATIRRRARFVSDACTQCNRCHVACPSVVPNEYQSGLVYRKAIYTPFHGAVPPTYAIDIEHCLNTPPNYLPCRRCIDVCEDHAIRFDGALETVVRREVSAAIVCVGYSLADSTPLKEFGYGEQPDILTYMELERLTSSVGPTGGYLEKISNEATPENVLYVIADSSRWSCLCAAAQTDRLVAQGITDITVLHPASTLFGDTFEHFWSTHTKHPVRLTEGTLDRLAPIEDDMMRAHYRRNGDAAMATQDFDMVVFTTAVQPSPGLDALAHALRIDLDDCGFIKRGSPENGMNATTRPGVYAAGCACGPKDVADSIAESKAAAIYALRHLDRRREATPLPELAMGGTEPASSHSTSSSDEIRGRIERVVVRLMEMGGGSIG